MIDLLRFLRVPLAPTAACDVAACLLLALGAAGLDVLPTPTEWAGLLGTSLCIYGFGMGLNDWADRRRDLERAPGRPLPSGRLSPTVALGVVIVLAAGALVLGGGPLGSREGVALALLLAATYDLAAKHALVPGALAMGGTRAVNAALGVVPLVHAGLAPAWTLVGPLSIGLWSAGATVLSTTEEHPSVARVRAARWLIAAAIVGGVTVGIVAAGRVTLPGALLAPSLLPLAFGRLPKPGPAKRQVLEVLLGLYLLAGAIAAGAGRLPVDLGAPILAFVLVYLSQRAIFALRPPAPPSAAAGSP